MGKKERNKERPSSEIINRFLLPRASLKESLKIIKHNKYVLFPMKGKATLTIKDVIHFLSSSAREVRDLSFNSKIVRDLRAESGCLVSWEGDYGCFHTR